MSPYPNPIHVPPYNFKTNKKETIIFFCATILFLAPLYITLYTWRGPVAIAIVEEMPRDRVMYSTVIQTLFLYLNNNTRLTHLSGK